MGFLSTTKDLRKEPMKFLLLIPLIRCTSIARNCRLFCMEYLCDPCAEESDLKILYKVKVILLFVLPPVFIGIVSLHRD